MSLFPLLAITFADEWVFTVTVGGALMTIGGWIAAVHALFATRTSQGTIAWVLSLTLMPVISLPLYMMLGRNRFQGYVEMRRQGNQLFESTELDLRRLIPSYKADLPEEDRRRFGILEDMADVTFSKDNAIRLLPDGNEAFAAIFAAIDLAERYILVQFYIVNDDATGRELQRRLIAKARAGVRVYFLCDEIGSYKLGHDFTDEMLHHGVRVARFGMGEGVLNQFQINFRNHRKMVVIDGVIGFTGGHNVGDEYLGKVPRFGDWRDTSIELMGPTVLQLQLLFLDDWHWSTGDIPMLQWKQPDDPDSYAIDAHDARFTRNVDAIVIPTGPTDRLEHGGLFFTHLINTARKELWIASPYFVPDRSQIAAIHLAAMRGVRVRIITPRHGDRPLTRLGNDAFLHLFDLPEIELYHYLPAFMHQKVVLVDDAIAAIGTANFDNRSFRLNFELMVCAKSHEFCWRTRKMLEHDLAHSERISARYMRTQPFSRRFLVQTARLLSPIL